MRIPAGHTSYPAVLPATPLSYSRLQLSLPLSFLLSHCIITQVKVTALQRTHTLVFLHSSVFIFLHLSLLRQELHQIRVTCYQFQHLTSDIFKNMLQQFLTHTHLSYLYFHVPLHLQKHITAILNTTHTDLSYLNLHLPLPLVTQSNTTLSL